MTINHNNSGHSRYYELLQKMVDIYEAKNHDYTDNLDPMANFKNCETFGISAWLGILIRMSDKWSRIKALANGRNPKVLDESLTDTLLDLANYALLCIILLQEEHVGN